MALMASGPVSNGGAVNAKNTLAASKPSTGIYGLTHACLNAIQSANKANNTLSSSSSGASSSSSDDWYKVLQEDRALSLQSAEATNKFNSEEAQKARDWQEYMSNTAHQRETEDLIKSGLNPVLSANNGANAYTAATASGVKPDTPSGANALSNIMAAAMTSNAMTQVAGINAASALAVARENHYNNPYGMFKESFEKLTDWITKNSGASINLKNLVFDTKLPR